jgi:hypothetical protein
MFRSSGDATRRSVCNAWRSLVAKRAGNRDATQPPGRRSAAPAPVAEGRHRAPDRSRSVPVRWAASAGRAPDSGGSLRQGRAVPRRGPVPPTGPAGPILLRPGWPMDVRRRPGMPGQPQAKTSTAGVAGSVELSGAAQPRLHSSVGLACRRVVAAAQHSAGARRRVDHEHHWPVGSGGTAQRAERSWTGSEDGQRRSGRAWAVAMIVGGSAETVMMVDALARDVPSCAGTDGAFCWRRRDSLVVTAGSGRRGDAARPLTARAAVQHELTIDAAPFPAGARRDLAGACRRPV